ncbi:MAG TPA: hypothetical protein VI456_08530 [Polyangia bacterium]
MTRGLTFPQLTAGLLFGALAVCACLMPAHSDSYWHLRAGQEIWRTLRVPLRDHYSYTADGRFWPDHEWLWQAIAYALYRLGGMRLLVAGGAAFVLGATAILYRLMVGSAGTRLVIMLLALPLSSCLWVLRPQVVTILLLALMLWCLVRGYELALPVLFLVWANAHGAVAMGGLLLAVVTLVAIARARGGDAPERRRARRLLVLTPICGLATALTPLGFGLWRYIANSMALSRENAVLEWQPVRPVGFFSVSFWVLAWSFVALVIWRRRRLRDAGWADAVLYTAALVVLPLAFRAIRNTAVFLMIAMPAASRLLGPDFRFGRGPARADAVEHPRLNLALLVGISLVEACGIAWAWSIPFANLGWRPLAPAAIAAVRACPDPIYNRYYDGGYLIWFVPERRVFIDNRQDPYPLAFTLAATGVDSGKPYRPLFDRYAIRCAFLPVESKTIDALAADHWRTTFRDDRWAVLTAPGAG